jgi:hypothetical protein
MQYIAVMYAYKYEGTEVRYGGNTIYIYIPLTVN